MQTVQKATNTYRAHVHVDGWVEEAVIRREDGSYLVDGLLPAAAMQKRLGMPGVDELARKYNFETAAGLLLTIMGRIPEPGDTAHWKGYRFEVVAMDRLRIAKILMRPP
ncbi:MAG: transporter associated domain-containing protein [Anaerolineales bacterium]